MDKFRAYLDKLEGLGSFNPTLWDLHWRNGIWGVCESIANTDPYPFLNALDQTIKNPAKVNKEILEYVGSEISYNLLPLAERRKLIENLRARYPHNPEFVHSLGSILAIERNFISAIDQFKGALKMDPTNRYYVKSRFNGEYSYLNELLSNGEYKKGKDYLVEINKENLYQSIELYQGDINYPAALTDLSIRFDDHLRFQERLTKTESAFRERMTIELENERRRIVEILGFFSGIIAFILSTVSIAKNFSFTQAIYFVIALGIVLILFTSSISVMLTDNKGKYYRSPAFWLLVIGLTIMLLLIVTTDNIATIVGNLRPKDD